MGAHPIQTSFNSGELSPRLKGRPDIERHKNGCEQLQNMLLYPHGAAKSRPGMRYVAETKTSASKSRLVPFVFSNTQAYVIEFGDTYIRFFYAGGNPILSAGVPYEIVSPYADTDLVALQFTQTADVLYIVHPDYAPRKLIRRDHDDWVLTVVNWIDGPYLPENTDGITNIRCSAVVGAGITVTAQYSAGTLGIGTYDETVGTPDDILTAARPFLVFIFTAKAGDLTAIKINVTTAAGAPDNATAYLHASSGGEATGAALATSGAVNMAGLGEKTFTFASTPTLVNGSVYALVIGIAATDAIQIDTSADNADYISGFAATATGVVTNLVGADWRMEITYDPAGRPSLFEAEHVGSTWRVRHSGKTVRATMNSVGDDTYAQFFRGQFYVDISPVNASPYWEGRIVLEKTFDGIYWYEVAAFHYSTKQEFFEIETGVRYRLRCTHYTAGSAVATISQTEQWGVFKITAVANAYTATADVISRIGATTMTPIWREGAWSGVRGYPSTIVFDSNDRLCLASTNYQLYQLWASWVGDYEQMTPGDTDDAALDLCLSKFNNRIYWIEGSDDMIVGTGGEEARLIVQKQAPLSATNPPKVSVQSREGSAQDIRPIQIGPALMFLDSSRRKLFEMAYSLESDSLIPNDLTLFSEHITESGITDFAYQKNPDSIVWCVRADGVLIGLTYFRKENVLGWHRHVTDGLVESVACVPSSLGATAGHTELWLIVKRTIGGAVKRYVEILADHESIEDPDSPIDYFCVDSGVTYDGVAATVITGLDHLEGETVAILADGLVCPQQEVVSGGITLETAASVVHAGLPYQCILKPMMPDINLPDGSSSGRERKITLMIAKFFRTLSGKFGESLTDLYEIPIFSPDVTLLDTAPALRSDDFETDWPGDWGKDKTPYIVQDDPLPICVQSIVTVVEVV